MPRGKNQKLKLLVLLRFLRSESDEQHPVAMKELLAELARAGIQAERKSIYDDLETLRDFGFDIVQATPARRGYFLGEREFELAELKLLVDAVQSSRFLTTGKSRALIGKMESMASRWQAGELRRQVHVADRVKTMNESVYYNIDTVHAAIAGEKRISFLYNEWAIEREGGLRCVRRRRREGRRYQVSPWELIWDNQFYYLVAFDGEAGRIKHYRVDKMERLAVVDKPREGERAFRDLDLTRYSRSVFGMYGGELRHVCLRFSDALAGAVVDRFGSELTFHDAGGGAFQVTVPVAISPQFFGWMAGFGSKAQILAPEAVAQEYRRWLSETLEAMEGVVLPPET